MMFHPRMVLCALGLVAVSACSHAAKSSSDAAPSPEMRGDVVIPARISSASVIRFRSVGSRPRGTVEIPVDANGRADVLGVRFMGTFSEVTRQDIIEFVEQANFVAATRNGVPERGKVKMTFK